MALSLLAANAAPVRAQVTIAVVTDPEGVFLRSGPGTGYTPLALIPRGSELPVLGAPLNNAWLPVWYQGKNGFVHTDFVEIKALVASPPTVAPAPPLPSGQPTLPATRPPTSLPPPPPPTSLPPPPPPVSPAVAPVTTSGPAQPAGSQPVPQQMRVTPMDGLRLRAGPSTDFPTITTIPYNTRLTVTARSPDGRWVQVTYGGQSGWVDSQFLSPVEDAGAAMASDAGSSRFIWPVSGRSITTPFSGAHPGIDIDQFPAGGNPVVAVAAGKVTFAGGNPCCSYGLYVRIDHKDNTTSLYAHLQTVDVSEGQEVKQGQQIGLSGNTGFSTGAHLHFELHMGGTPVDPMGQLPKP